MRNTRRKRAIRHLLRNKFTYFFAFIIVCCLLFHFSPQPSTDNPNPRKAAIVDHLSLSEPNQTFIQTSTTILEKTGFIVDYYPSEEVTINFFRNLPEHGYGLIVLRVHSTISYPDNRVILFTSEPYSKTKYVYEQLTGRVGIVCFQLEGPYYFGITPDFVKLSVNGRFQNTIIIMMGCNGLKYTSMAEAFIEKGAKVYISWSGSVLASHTDQVTTHLLQHIITEKQTIKKAITGTMKEVGPDPVYKSVLTYYPIEASS